MAGVITKRDLEQISWSILWMIAGAFALGVAMRQSGLAAHMIEAIPFGQWSPLAVIIGSGLLCYLMANFISHTATAALFVPILAIAGASMEEQLGAFGGVSTLLIGVAICSSLAMVLPHHGPRRPCTGLRSAHLLRHQRHLLKPTNPHQKRQPPPGGCRFWLLPGVRGATGGRARGRRWIRAACG